MYGTKKTTKGANKGAQGQDLKNKVTVNAETKGKDNVVEGKKVTDTEELIKNDSQSRESYNKISAEINKVDDEKKEAEIRKETPGATTEINNKGIGITKDENTGSNKNTVKEDKKEEPVKELVSENGTKTTIDIKNVVDVPAEETRTPVVEDKKEEKTEENTTKGIQSMFGDEEDDDNEVYSKQEIKTEETAKVETPVVETKEITKEVLPTTESTEEETAKVVAEEKKSVETKEAQKAEVVEKTVEVKKEVKKQEEKPAPANAQFADTVVTVDRTQNATFVVTSGRVVSVQNSDEQIAVSNNGSSIVVTNNYPEFDGTVSFTAVDEAGQSTTLTVIFK